MNIPCDTTIWHHIRVMDLIRVVNNYKIITYKLISWLIKIKFSTINCDWMFAKTHALQPQDRELKSEIYE